MPSFNCVLPEAAANVSVVPVPARVVASIRMNVASLGTVLVVTSPFGVSKIPTMEAEEFPKMPTLENAEKHGVSCADLSKMISGVLFCASEDQARYNLQSVHVESKAKKLADEGKTKAYAKELLKK